MARGSRLTSEKRRNELQRAAYRQFRDFGYHETTVDDICRVAGASKGSFYWCYESKQDVFIDILETWTREVMDQLHQQFDAALRKDDYIRATTEALEREIKRGRVIVPLWLDFTVQARRDAEIRDALSKFYRRARAAIAEMLRPGFAGILPDAAVQGIAATIFGAYAGLMMQELADPERADARQAVHDFMVLLRHLVRPDRTLVGAAPPAEPDRVPRRATDEAVADLFGAGASPELAERFAELRALVQADLPDADERVIKGWKVLAYERDGLICYLRPRRAEIHVGFYRGAELPDPAGMLAGAGKRERYVAVPVQGGVDTEALRELIRAAATGPT